MEDTIEESKTERIGVELNERSVKWEDYGRSSMANTTSKEHQVDLTCRQPRNDFIFTTGWFVLHKLQHLKITYLPGVLR